MNTFGRGKKRKKEKSKHFSDEVGERLATETKATTSTPTTTTTTTTFTNGFASKVKYFLPNVTSVTTHGVTSSTDDENEVEKKNNNLNNNNNNRSYSRMWKRRRKVTDDSLLNDNSIKNCPVIVVKPDHERAKNKLLTIVQNDRMTSQIEDEDIVAVVPAADELKSPAATDDSVKHKPGGFFLQRGSNLISSVRSSLRKMGYTPNKKSSSPELSPASNVDVVEEMTSLKLEDANSNDSQVMSRTSFL